MSSSAAELPPTSFQKLHVGTSNTIRKFVLAQGLTYKAGCSFYQLTKPEQISSKKLLIAEEISSGRMIIGDAVRKILKIDESATLKVTVDAKQHAGYNIYVRSDSYNRKLVTGTSLVYVTDMPKDMIDVDDVEADDDEDVDANGSSSSAPPANPLLYMGAPAQHVQMAISFDTTGSMYSYLDEVKRFAKDTINRVLSLGSQTVEMCIIAHGDYCDENVYYLMRSSGFSSDVNFLVNFIEKCGHTGGGDLPEAYEYVLGETLKLDWKPEAQKSLLMIGDALPHEDHQARYDWKEEVKKYAERAIKIYAIQCGGDVNAARFYETIADDTMGVHLPLKKVAEITDFVVAIAYAEGNPRMILDYHEALKKKRGGALSDSLTSLFAKISSRTGVALPTTKRPRDDDTDDTSAAGPSGSTTTPPTTPPSKKPRTSTTPTKKTPRPLMRLPSSLESMYDKLARYSAEIHQIDRPIAAGLFCPTHRINLKNKSLYVPYVEGMFIDDRVAGEMLLYDEVEGKLYEGDEVREKVDFERSRSYNVSYLTPRKVEGHWQLLVRIVDVQYMLTPGTLVLVR
ncbi:hypothetical protein HDV00_005918 [Rhizophlyctis rosea]|nr:hypothetical protein HDV00_005918 [Rhizophlyctis rosea]